MANFKQYFFNEYKIYSNSGNYYWIRPADLDGSKPILVHVWGAGGRGDDYYTWTATGNGGGGGRTR